MEYFVQYKNDSIGRITEGDYILLRLRNDNDLSNIIAIWKTKP